MKTLFFLFTFIVFSTQASGEHWKLMARAGDYDGFNIPARSSLANISPVLNHDGDLAFVVKFIEGNSLHGIWYKGKDQKQGKLIYKAPKQRFVSTPSISHKKVIFTQHDFGIVDGVIEVDGQTGKAQIIVDPKYIPNNFSLSDPQYFKGGIILRSTNQENLRSIWMIKNQQYSQLLSEGNGISYLFSPVVGGEDFLFLKRRLGQRGDLSESNPDQYIGLDHNGIEVLVHDRNSNSNSPIQSFHNSAGVSGNGNFCVVTRLEKSKALYCRIKGQTQYIIKEGEGPLKEFEYFRPSVNDQGEVAFRGIDQRGERNIFYYFNGKLKSILKEGSLLQTDRENARVLKRDGWPGFSGHLSLNNRGELAVHLLLETKDAEEMLGAAVYMVRPSRL